MENNDTNAHPKYMKSNYKPGWLSQIDLHTSNTRGRMKEMIEVTKAYDEILTQHEKALVTAFTEQIESLCAKLIQEVFKLNPYWEILLNPEKEWQLKKKDTTTE